ncbi:MAG: hypothetical protein MRY64_04475 [Hyphomonadaceae bacterium]|nr:hypothetical protein [Hyphomonadaceae bacterium]
MANDSASMIAGLIFLIFYAAIIIVSIIAYWKIWSKAGFNGAWSLLMIIPIVGFISFLYLGFAEWPVRKQMGSDPRAFD